MANKKGSKKKAVSKKKPSPKKNVAQKKKAIPKKKGALKKKAATKKKTVLKKKSVSKKDKKTLITDILKRAAKLLNHPVMNFRNPPSNGADFAGRSGSSGGNFVTEEKLIMYTPYCFNQDMNLGPPTSIRRDAKDIADQHAMDTDHRTTVLPEE